MIERSSADQVELLDRRSESGWEAHAATSSEGPLATHPCVPAGIPGDAANVTPPSLRTASDADRRTDMITQTEHSALRRALELAAAPGVPLGPNPRVGCVLVAPDGKVLAEGHHRGAGAPHAEADALARAGTELPAGTTAVVTLEPCAHTGRTPPCTEALIAAGITRAVIARRDPNPLATGGIDRPREAGIDVDLDVPDDLSVEAAALNRGWEHGLQHDRPLVTAKMALTLDGRIAAADGTSRWITGARDDPAVEGQRDRKSTRLNSSHVAISYAGF